jgi:hypothetical protein
VDKALPDRLAMKGTSKTLATANAPERVEAAVLVEAEPRIVEACTGSEGPVVGMGHYTDR